MYKKRKRRKKKNSLGFIWFLAIFLMITIFILDKDEIEPIILDKAGQYDPNKFDRTGKYYYYEDDIYKSIAGIDVSEHNGDIDWNKVKKSGIEFAFIRIGWRGYTEGSIYKDKLFEQNYKEAKNSGLKIGIYFFSQAITSKEAKEEALFVKENLKDKSLELPIVYDFETVEANKGRANHLNKQEVSTNAKAFFSILEDDYGVMLYANMPLLKLYDESLLDTYPLWFAQFYHKPETLNDFVIWQYSEKGKVPGISKNTDLNIMMIKK